MNDPRIRRASILLVLAAFLCGCGERAPEASDDAGGTTAETPSTPDASDPAAWLDESPRRAHMRALWIDCANIVHFAHDPERAHFDSIECAGEDLARKAGRYAGFWDAVETAAEKTSAAARTGAWDQAGAAYAGVWKACCDCHVETWPLALRGYSAVILRSWVDTGKVQAEVTWTTAYDDRLRATPLGPFHERMQKLDDWARTMADGLTERDPSAVAESATFMVTQLEAERDYWWSIHDRGKALQQAAAKGRLGVIKSLYAGIANTCHDCHVLSVTGDRKPLDPPPWTSPPGR